MEPRLRDEHAALEAAFREDIGEEGYDAFLYATGQPNRVLVREVIARSPASRAGVQAGDVIVSYDGTRTFLPRDLQLATGQGKRGELVRVEVVRDGRPLTLRVQRGPLGIILGGSAEPPRSPS
jgi:S1-C subfamily serine protease